MTALKTTVLLIAAAFTAWATASYLSGIGTDADFKLPAVVAVVLLGIAIYLDYRAQEQLQRRREIAATWARRYQEAQRNV